ncbi:hypothetical protein MSM1_21365, partial [Mycobacterium sp. SM1]
MTSTSQLVVMVHHLVIDAVSWGIVLEDLNTAWAQPWGAAGGVGAGGDVVCPVGGGAGGVCASGGGCGSGGVWRQVAAVPAALPA